VHSFARWGWGTLERRVLIIEIIDIYYLYGVILLATNFREATFEGGGGGH
jgi:hypothetical protein